MEQCRESVNCKIKELLKLTIAPDRLAKCRKKEKILQRVLCE